MRMNLFDGSDDTDDTDDISKIETNLEFARRYEYNKKREELGRLEELKKKGLVEDSDESSSEDDDEEFVGLDLKFLDALIKVKNKDPVITQKDVKLFESESEDEEGEEDKKIHRSAKPTYLKDVNGHDLEQDFDPEEYDRKMKKTFNDGYYGAEDEHPDFGNEDDDALEKPDFAKEDELLGLTKEWDVCGSGDGFSAVREKVLKSKAAKKDVVSTNEDEQKEDEGAQEDDDLPKEGKRKS